MNRRFAKGLIGTALWLFAGLAAATPYEFDYAISKQLKAYLSGNVPPGTSSTNPRYEVANGVVLLTGTLKNQSDVDRFGTFAQRLPNVKRVENAVTVGGVPAAHQQKTDNSIERSLVAAEHTNHFLRVVASQRVLYLLGFVTKVEKDAIVAQAQQVNNVKRIVLLFEYIDTPEDLTIRSNAIPAAVADDEPEDEDMTRDEALSILASAALNHATANKSHRQNSTAQMAAISPRFRETSQLNGTQVQPSVSTNHTANGTGPSTIGSPDNSLDYDQAVSECVAWERHPTLKAYMQFRNTCGFEVYVLRCMVTNNVDGCAARQWGSFTLKPYGTDISTAMSVKWVACRSPYVALGSKVTMTGGGFSAPCQKRKP